MQRTVPVTWLSIFIPSGCLSCLLALAVFIGSSVETEHVPKLPGSLFRRFANAADVLLACKAFASCAKRAFAQVWPCKFSRCQNDKITTITYDWGLITLFLRLIIIWTAANALLARECCTTSCWRRTCVFWSFGFSYHGLTFLASFYEICISP